MKDYFNNIDVIEENLKYFTDHHKDIYSAYEEYGKLVHEEGGPIQPYLSNIILHK